jgi:4-hydroxy-2-oxoheptanedioate aldolase
LENTLKSRLLAGEPAFGVQVDFAAPEIVEALGYLGFDWVFLDAEHGAISEEAALHMVRAAETAGIVPVVRVPRNEAATILRYLETGVMGVVVPQVGTAEEARRAVDAVRYPPLGRRGIGGSRASGFGFRQTLTEYRQQANEQLMVIPIIESAQGVAHLDEILTVDGIDAILVGPADLAASLGLPIDFRHPEVVRVVDDVLSRVCAAGRIAGVNPGSDGARARELTARGVRLFVTGVWAFLGAGARGFLDAARSGT